MRSSSRVLRRVLVRMAAESGDVREDASDPDVDPFKSSTLRIPPNDVRLVGCVSGPLNGSVCGNSRWCDDWSGVWNAEATGIISRGFWSAGGGVEESCTDLCRSGAGGGCTGRFAVAAASSLAS